MFWGCFSWDRKGPCHVWTKETIAERKAADKELEELNISLKPELKMSWEISNGVSRPPGRRPQWRFNKANGKLVREGKSGGIDWFRYELSL